MMRRAFTTTCPFMFVSDMEHLGISTFRATNWRMSANLPKSNDSKSIHSKLPGHLPPLSARTPAFVHSIWRLATPCLGVNTVCSKAGHVRDAAAERRKHATRVSAGVHRTWRSRTAQLCIVPVESHVSTLPFLPG